jgi:hypothetical protein
MTRQPVVFPPMPAPSDAKRRCRRAYDEARKADPRSAALYDRWLADTLLAAEGQPDDARATMFTRMGIALEVMADRTGARSSAACAPGCSRFRAAPRRDCRTSQYMMLAKLMQRCVGH